MMTTFRLIWSMVAVVLIACTSAVHGFGVIDFEVTRGDSFGGLSSDNQIQLVVRDGVDGGASLRLSNMNTYFMANLTMGSDNQTVGVLVDTGSSDLWVVALNAYCYGLAGRLINDTLDYGNDSTSQYVCSKYGTFNPNTSLLFDFQDNMPDFSVYYADSLYASGIWAFEDFMIGSLELKGLTFALANYTSLIVGVLGLGLVELEDTYYDLWSGFTYPNMPALLKSSGAIERNAFSVYLGEDRGQLLFGAVDMAKVDGDLTSFPLVVSSEPGATLLTNPSRFAIVLTEMSVSSKDGSYNIIVTKNPHPVIIDTGSTYITAPRLVVQNIAKALKGKYDKSNGLYRVPCPQEDDSAVLAFNFSGQSYNIPIASSLVNYDGTCYLAMVESYLDHITGFVLGQSFLEHMYVVYDADSKEIAMAKVKHASESSIVSITTTVGTQAPHYSQTATLDLTDDETSVKNGFKYSTGDAVPTQSRPPSYGASKAASLPRVAWVLLLTVPLGALMLFM